PTEIRRAIEISRCVEDWPSIRSSPICAYVCEVVNDLVGLGLCRLRHDSKKQKYGHQNERNHGRATRQSAAVSFLLRHCPPFFRSTKRLDIPPKQYPHIIAPIPFAMLMISSKRPNRMGFPLAPLIGFLADLASPTARYSGFPFGGGCFDLFLGGEFFFCVLDFFCGF